MKIELHPFPVPDSVTQKAAPQPRQNGIQFATKYQLSGLDETTLADMCDAFRKEIFRKAGKTDPALSHMAGEPIEVLQALLGQADEVHHFSSWASMCEYSEIADAREDARRVLALCRQSTK